MKLYYLALSIIVISLLLSSASHASSGTVILAKGVVTATGTNKSNRVLAKGAAIEEGDIINTANKSFAVIRMLDNTKLTLKPGTTIAIGKFNVEKGKEEGCINLVKGGLRTVTGLIGKRKPDSFQVDTPIASIGIRGTDFITRICAGDECIVDEQELSIAEYGEPEKSQSSEIAELINQQLPEGLYGSCETGAIVMSKCAGQSEGFELGKCRINQQTDCTEVGLSAGAAGYTSFTPSEGSVPAARAKAGGTTALPQKPVVLSRTPRILNRDPYFQLSDASDAELDKVDRFPNTLNTDGQCSIYGS
jgi:hypothetical protein